MRNSVYINLSNGHTATVYSLVDLKDYAQRENLDMTVATFHKEESNNAELQKEIEAYIKECKDGFELDLHTSKIDTNPVLETERATDWVVLTTEADKLEDQIESFAVECINSAKWKLKNLRSEINKIYLRKIDKSAINKFYTCEVV